MVTFPVHVRFVIYFFLNALNTQTRSLKKGGAGVRIITGNLTLIQS